jgi:hypothetical protein
MSLSWVAIRSTTREQERFDGARPRVLAFARPCCRFGCEGARSPHSLTTVGQVPACSGGCTDVLKSFWARLARARWKKSIRSTISNDCVEVRLLFGYVRMRDSKNRRTGPLSFRRRCWDDFLYAVRQGEFDRTHR